MSLPRAVILALSALAVAAAAPAPAVAGFFCFNDSATTKKLGDFAPPLIIGDSVLLGAVDAVAKRGWTVNAHGCRSWSEGARIVRKKAAEKRLPHMVAMFLGADWEIS